MNLEPYLRERLDGHRILLMGHLVVGHPSLEANWRMLELMAEAGVDLVELQLPFSEPMADGPAFVRANQQALERGTTREDYFTLFARAARAFPYPCLFMGYYNAVFRLGHAAFCDRLGQAGGAGFILPDLPVEEYGDLFEQAAGHRLAPILLMAPTNTEAHLAAIGAKARGFVYAVARKGVTGKRTSLDAGIGTFLSRCRQATALPLGVGFGLRQGTDLRALHGLAEIGIVGSALLAAWETGGESGYRALLTELAAARN